MKLMLNINRKSYSLIVTVIILMSSCRQQSLPNSLEAINIINKDRPIELDIYDIVDSISYIPLETLEKCLLGELKGLRGMVIFILSKILKGYLSLVKTDVS